MPRTPGIEETPGSRKPGGGEKRKKMDSPYRAVTVSAENDDKIAELASRKGWSKTRTMAHILEHYWDQSYMIDSNGFVGIDDNGNEVRYVDNN